jgi:hypothetical protein
MPIGDNPNTVKETRLLHTCYLDCLIIEFSGARMLCLVFEELDFRTILPMTESMDREEEIRSLIRQLTELRDTDETKGSTDN